MGYIEPIRAAALACLCLGGAAFAQMVEGIVTCEGRPVKDARVTSAELGIRVRTDSLGRFAILSPTRSVDPRLDRAAPPAGARADLPADRFSSDGAWFRPDGRIDQSVFGPGVPSPAALARRAADGLELTIEARGMRPQTLVVPEGKNTAAASLRRDRRRHLWIWETAALTQAAVRDSLFAFARRKGVGTLYPNAGGVLGKDDATLARFVDAAAAQGLQVELLFGAPQWALASEHAKAVALARQAKAFTLAQDARLAAAPVGIQFDVEPYSLDAYAADPQGVGSQWVDMYVVAGAALKGAGIALTACVPRWLETRSVTRGGVTRPLNEWLADASDRLTLMDYVDKAKGIIDGAAGELAYADAHGKEVVVGLETIAGLDPPSVTFAEEGEAAMEAATGTAEPVFLAHPSYFGTAIHHWRSYQTMKP